MKRCGKKGSVFLVVLPLVIILGLVLLFNFNTFNTGHATFAGGDGSSGNPYQIATCVQLQGMEDDLSSDYILIGNIDCSDTINWNSGKGFDTMGKTDMGSFFTGYLEGQGYNIEGLYMNRPSTPDDYAGIFGWAEPEYIANISLININITSGTIVGGLIGYALRAHIINISFYNSSVSGSSNYVAGLVGNAGDTVVEYSSFEGNVTGTNNAAGLVSASGGTINYSYFIGNVFSSNAAGKVGGISADNYASLNNVYSSTNFSSSVATIGGVCANEQSGSFLNNFYDGNASSSPVTDSRCGALGKTNSQMKQQATFTGWDFTNIWKIDEDSSYPCFIWQDSCPTLNIVSPNTAPNLTQVFISPNSSVSESDNLSGYCNATDADADNVTYYYNWYLGGALNTSGLTSSQTQAELINVNNVSSSLTSKDQNWTLECTANDGTVNSTAINSTQITIGNTAPVVSNVEISPSPIYETHEAECTYTFSDSDSDADSSTIEWFVNSVSVQSGSLATLSNSYLNKDETVYCSVTGNDGSVTISAVDSDELVIKGTTSSPGGGGGSDTPTTTEAITTTETDVPETTISQKEKPKEDIKELILSRTGFSDGEGGVKKVSNVLKDIREEPVAGTIVISLMLLLLLLLILLYFVIRKYVKFRNELHGKKNREDVIAKKRVKANKEGFLSRITSKLALKLTN